MLAMQVMAIPIAFIGNAVSQVYLAHASEKLQQGQLKEFTITCLYSLFKIGVLPLILISILSPYAFPLIFGAEWERSGEMMVWMIPWFCFQLLVSPISMSLNILNEQKIALLLQIIGLIIRYFGVCVLFYLSISSKLFEYYAISGGIFYFLYLCVTIYVINIYDKNINKFYL